jgi:ubiquinone/menaquinone biosynthesis C-methylase UbiE
MLISAIEGHRFWAPRYDSGQNPLLAVESRIVQRLLRGSNPRRVVDVACGTGRWMLYFHRCGAAVVGLDACREMLVQAGQHEPLRSRLILGDAQHMPFADEVADLVICSFAASYICNLGQLMKELARITQRGGRVVVSDMHRSAVAAGWQRSFKIGASLYELQQLDYSPDQLRAAGETQSLQLDSEMHGFFEESEHPIFELAGKHNVYSRLATVPAVWAGIWTKACC